VRKQRGAKQAVLEIEAPKDLRGLARNWLRKIAACELKARGPRKEGGILSDWARRLFRGKSLQRDPGDRLRDLDAGAARGKIINDPKETCPTGAAEECLLGTGYRGGSGRGVGDGGEAGEGLMV